MRTAYYRAFLPVLMLLYSVDYGWHLIWQLPPGVSFNDIKAHKQYFQDACNSWIELEWKHGKCHMNVQAGELPEMVPYHWEPGHYESMSLPIPVGYSRVNLYVFDLVDSPHFLIGGSTGYGKTSLERVIIHSLIDRAVIVIIDFKQVDLEYLRDRIILAVTDEEALAILEALNREYERRIQLLRRYKVTKIQEYPHPEEMPFIVVIVDELAELDDRCKERIDRLARLARATGISLIVASQRTSTKVVSGDTRFNFVARICYKVPSPADFRVILGEDCGLAGDLPSTKGRCIFRFGLETVELQSMHLPIHEAMKLLLPDQRRWDAHVKPDRPDRDKLEVKRLAPR